MDLQERSRAVLAALHARDQGAFDGLTEGADLVSLRAFIQRYGPELIPEFDDLGERGAIPLGSNELVWAIFQRIMVEGEIWILGVCEATLTEAEMRQNSMKRMWKMVELPSDWLNESDWTDWSSASLSEIPAKYRASILDVFALPRDGGKNFVESLLRSMLVESPTAGVQFESWIGSTPEAFAGWGMLRYPPGALEIYGD